MLVVEGGSTDSDYSTAQRLQQKQGVLTLLNAYR